MSFILESFVDETSENFEIEWKLSAAGISEALVDVDAAA
jgi:hypothetical protein